VVAFVVVVDQELAEGRDEFVFAVLPGTVQPFVVVVFFELLDVALDAGSIRRCKAMFRIRLLKHLDEDLGAVGTTVVGHASFETFEAVTAEKLDCAQLVTGNGRAPWDGW
jgi:hypothetical protein